MNSLHVHVEGIGLWSPQLPGFDAFRRQFAGETLTVSHAHPSALALSPNERRRAPESVLVAIEAASQAVAASGRTADHLACVFASAYGDQATTDYMCRVLAGIPTELSPTRFHNSVHNASAGYWTIATGCRAPSSAVCAGNASFGAGLLEAAVLACADHRPVLLVCSDTAGTGPLGELIGCTRVFGCALVLSPGTTTGIRLRLAMTTSPARSPMPDECRAWMHDNPAAESLPLLAMLATGHGDCVLAASEHLGLRVEMETNA
ncbi:beta-ketoacyl synthase chain length factor [Dyella sp.]|uniref:beta-ketoacyl synthase chain length factor n=1 Tax=Dyella sp. TaxID=1869338 RepID=UPI002B46E84A|nr:beta-ketoacyl synthase chain length factor [Dyella sp.]HKT26838.1 beta-ketoacyl synthase chain length factor [Dyella sp.]